MARPLKRDEDITSRVDEEKLLDLYKDVEKGFEAQRDRCDDIMDNWDMYNCVLSDNQFYNGTSQIATPFVRDAVEARVTRFTNQVFPLSGRYVEVTSGEEDPPQATQAILESYVRKTKLRTGVVPSLLRNGDIEGQWNIYVDWVERKRQTQTRVMVQPKTDGIENPAAEPVEDIKPEEITDRHPRVEVINDADVLILPATMTVEEALDCGGSVTIIRRWSKGKIRQLIDDEDIREDEGEALITEMSNQRASKDRDTAKEQLDVAGIKERGKVALVYETWSVLKVGKKDRRLCRVFFAGGDAKEILGVKLNPFWNDRCPLISAAVIKQSGAGKGRAIVCDVADLWIFSNDTLNEGADTAHFSAMPIVMTDPLENPRAETMTLGLGAVWEVKPQSTEIVTFPALWQDAFQRALAIQTQIFQTLSVNPSMIPQQTGGQQKKRNQAELATEQMVDILTTADVVTNFEEAILTPLIQRFAEYDHQFRDEATVVRVYGEMGVRANMEVVEPIQLGERFEFRWFGVEAARNAAQMQQQIAWVNVFKTIPPTMYPDYEADLSPMLVQGTENVFGPRLAPLIFKKKKLIAADPMLENEMLLHGFEVHTAPLDDDLQHIQVHLEALQAGDPHGQVRAHIERHKQQLQQKMTAQMQQGQPGVGGAAPGGGAPKPGAQPAMPRQNKGPPGMISPERMPASGAVTFPRKVG